MRKFLVVGCGGSGGVTLRYLMDQLEADLRDAGWSKGLPAAWQFVHVDVPLGADSGPGRLRSVDEQGGLYQSLSYRGATYGDVASRVDEAFSKGRETRLLSSWRPEPSSVGFPIVNGAGQFRAVGRTLALAQAAPTLDKLNVAWSRLRDAKVDSEMGELTRALPGLGDVEAQELVFVVSSMAGGSGAAMVLDVARLLGQVEGLDPGSVAMFLFTPDVFEALPSASRPGVDANAAATLAELIAAQAHGQSQASEDRTYEILGLRVPGADTKRAFGRVFPIGRRIGDGGALLGDGQPTTVFRALGRGLAGLMMAGAATERFADYDVTNVDAGGRTDQFGWGVDPASDITWGSFGFASLSLGRERYASYAAQRLARDAVDRLAVGHEQAGAQGSAVEQVRALVDQQLSPWMAGCELSRPRERPRVWFTTVAFPEAKLNAATGAVIHAEFDPYIRPPVKDNPAAAWLDVTRQDIERRTDPVRARIDAEARRWAIAWHRELTTAIEKRTEQAVANLGLPFAIELLKQARQTVEQAVSDLRSAGASPGQPTRWSGALGSQIEALRNAKVSNPDEVRGLVGRAYHASVFIALRARSASLAADVLESMAKDLFGPLEEACRDTLTDVERARRASVSAVGLAQLDTDEYPAWPDASDLVPERFDEAVNELLLSPSQDFPALFASHLLADEPGLPIADTTARVTGAILLGEWPTVAGTKPPGGLLERTATWRPGAIQSDPESGQPFLAARARYAVNAGPGDVLDRAKLFVARPGQAFARYTGQSLHDFVAAEGASESERLQRVNDVVGKFRQTLHLARPLVGVSTSVVKELHGDDQRIYKFGAVPMPSDVVRQLESILEDAQENINSSSLDALRKAVSDDSRATRIDVFGSYPLCFPVVFSSLLRPISSRWAAMPDFARADFWRWRRARPLTAALPMGQSHRRAMVAGWLVGQITGRLVVPHDVGKSGADPVRVWDVSSSAWVSFPRHLLVPRSRMHAPADVLAAVLETMVIAIADGHDARKLDSLRPYKALRSLYDETEQQPATGLDTPVGAAHLARWAADGRTESGLASVVGPDLSTREERVEAAKDWLAKTAEAVRYRDGLGPDLIDPNRPLVLDLADDIEWATGMLRQLLDQPPDISPPVDGDDPFGSAGGLEF